MLFILKSTERFVRKVKSTERFVRKVKSTERFVRKIKSTECFVRKVKSTERFVRTFVLLKKECFFFFLGKICLFPLGNHIFLVFMAATYYFKKRSYFDANFFFHYQQPNTNFKKQRQNKHTVNEIQNLEKLLEKGNDADDEYCLNDEIEEELYSDFEDYEEEYQDLKEEFEEEDLEEEEFEEEEFEEKEFEGEEFEEEEFEEEKKEQIKDKK